MRFTNCKAPDSNKAQNEYRSTPYNKLPDLIVSIRRDGAEESEPRRAGCRVATRDTREAHVTTYSSACAKGSSYRSQIVVRLKI